MDDLAGLQEASEFDWARDLAAARAEGFAAGLERAADFVYGSEEQNLTYLARGIRALIPAAAPEMPAPAARSEEQIRAEERKLISVRLREEARAAQGNRQHHYAGAFDEAADIVISLGPAPSPDSEQDAARTRCELGVEECEVMRALRARVERYEAALQKCQAIAESYDDIEHWSECDAASSDEHNTGDDPACNCSRGAVHQIANIARAALGKSEER